MFIDKKGKLFSKISIVDLVIVLAILGLIAGYVLRTVSSETKKVVSANATFYVTFVVEKIRGFTVDAVSEGDVFYQQYVGAPLGSVTNIKTETAYELIKKNDGTAIYMPMEEKYNLYITLECSGNINADGYYINGNNHLAAGSDIRIKSNMLLCSARVHEITETAE